ncbi:MAG: Bug family tripartite tricarboxylate transporter substrate binding protein [Sphingomicrobium sp.]
MLRVLSSGLICLGLCSVELAAQTDYPSRPVRIVVPSAPAGGTDIVARVLAQQLSKSIGQQFFVENRPGAGQMLGIEAVAQSAPDGYTLLMAASTLAINPLMYKKVRYDAVRDFAPITQVASLPNVLVVNPSRPIHSLAELIAVARQRPDELTYASAGIGTSPHMGMELLKSMAGINVRHIPHKGTAAALTDIIAGRVATMLASVISAKPHVDAGTLRALAVSGPRRVEGLAGIPTVAEAGVPKYEALQWYGLLAPAGTPAAVVARLQSEVAQALRLPEVKERLATDGAEPVGGTPSEFAALIKSEIEKWASVARAANIQPE